MPTTTNVKQVKVNIMTKAQAEQATISPNEFYAITDAAISYNDLEDKPTIGNATLTIQQNGTTVDTFTANATSDKTINITVPTNNNQLTNGAGYITSSALSGYQTTANLVTSVSSSSTDTQYPSAKLFYDTCGDIETLINAL